MTEDEQGDFRPPDRFSLVRRIGEGGMGVVFEALDRQKQMRVALKTLPMSEPSRLLRLKQEFRNFTDVTHPNLAVLHELVSDGDTWFFTMELVDGVDFLRYVRFGFEVGVVTGDSKSWDTTSIHQQVPTEPSPTSGLHVQPMGGILSGEEQYERLRSVLRQLAEGVSAIHEAGRLHRDLKPSNVLVTRDGRVVILDFGLSMSFQSSTVGVSDEDNISGTAAYMSPEQAAPGTKQTPASDWYAVGVMLFEALTGQLPFVGSSFRILKSKLTKDPPSIRDFAGDLPDDLADLCMRLIARDPATRPTGDDILRHFGASPASSSGVTRETPLIGRAEQLGALRSALESTRAQKTVVAFVHGTSGVGKSFLVDQFLSGLRDQDDTIVLKGRCFEAESVPYKALDSTIDALARHLRRSPLAAEIVPRDVRALTRLFPVLRQIESFEEASQAAPDIPNPIELRRRAVGALHDLLNELGHRAAVVVCIDDLQWGDVDSANLLVELLRPPTAPPMFLLGVYRSEYEATSASLRMLLKSSIGDTGGESRLDLGIEALTEDQAVRLALELLGGNGSAQRDRAMAIAAESGGLPFFVHELARYTLEMPQEAANVSISDVLVRRFASLSPPARRLLELISVLGRPVRRGDLFHASHLAAEDRVAFSMLRGSFMIRGTGPSDDDDVEVYHDRIREAMVAQLQPDDIEKRYASLSETLESSGAYDPETLAICFKGCGAREKAGMYYADAAREASTALAFDRAANLYHTSLELRPGLDDTAKSELDERLAEALANAGRATEAAHIYERAVKGASDERAIELERHAAFHYCSSGRLREGREALTKLLHSQGFSLPSSGGRMIALLLWSRFRLWLRGLGFTERPEEAISSEALTRIDVSWSASAGLSMMDIIAGATFQTRNLILALDAGEPYRIARALAWEAAHTSNSGSDTWSRTRVLLDAAGALAEQVGHPHAIGMSTMARGIAEFTMGRWNEAVPLLSEAESMFRDRCTGVTWELDTTNAFKLWGLVYQGEMSEMAARTKMLMVEAEERGDLYASTNLESFMLPHAKLSDDEPDAAREAVRSSQQRWAQEGFHLQNLTGLMSSTLIDLYEGDGASAFSRIDGSWKTVEGAQILRIQVLRVFLRHFRARSALEKALVSPDSSRLIRFAAKLADAIAREGAPWAQPMARTLRAAIASQAGDRARAAELFAEADTEFEAASMWSYAASARRRSGELNGEPDRIASADELMRSRGVKNPEKMSRMHLPGVRIH